MTQRFHWQSVQKITSAIFKTGVGSLAYLLKMSSQEIVMAAVDWKAGAAGAASLFVASFWANSALASQGPGTTAGTASHFTQLAMAVLVYGLSALVIGAGLIGALRRH